MLYNVDESVDLRGTSRAARSGKGWRWQQQKYQSKGAYELRSLVGAARVGGLGDHVAIVEYAVRWNDSSIGV